MPDRHPHPHVPELLAPAGDPDAFRAAVQNGADAVYLGLSQLNARRGARNLTLEELSEACDHAHLRGVKVYLTANILVLGEEMERAVGLVADAWRAGVDAVIVQDLGLVRLLRSHLPEACVHASTQIGAHNTATLRALDDLGVSRVTLARELSLSGIRRLVGSTGLELESFVHGSLCVSYSGQCLMSSMVGGRSANRGLCTQPCRLRYRLVRDGEDVDIPGRHLLSPKDLAGLSLLPGLARTGVSALKVEGRMKSPEYVALVVGVYRRALDRMADDPDDFEPTEGEWDVLEEAFTRGFTEGYLGGVSDDRLMSYTRPNDRGVLVGRVDSVRGGEAHVALDRPVEEGDRLEFWTASGRLTQDVRRMRLGDREVSTAPGGTVVALTAEGSVRSGDRVFRVRHASLEEAARRTFTRAEEMRPVPLDIAVRLRVGEPLRIRVSAQGVSAEAEGVTVEPARTKAITAEQVMEHVGRLGGTPYEPASWELEIDPAAGLGYSQLHRLRREAVELLDERRLAPYRSRASRMPDSVRDRVSPPSLGTRGDTHAVRLTAVTDDPAAVTSLSDAGADRVLLRVWGASSETPPEGAELLAPRIAHERELDRILGFARTAGTVVAGNLGMLRRLSEDGSAVEADWPVGVLNPWTAGLLEEWGVHGIWASPELTREQLAAITGSTAVRVGLTVYGRQELMVTEHCVLATGRSCDGRCETCASRSSSWEFVDDKGYRFPVETDPVGRSHVYNSRVLDLTSSLDEVLDCGITDLRVEPRPAEDDPVTVVRRVRERLDAVSRGTAAERRGGDVASGPIAEEATTGHFYRGVD